MNKYQEALDRLKDIQSNLIALNSSGRLNKHRTDDLKVIHRATIKLQELVGRETPMKLEKGLMSKHCGKCKSGVWCSHNISWESKYCSKCGQKIDWSDEE